MSGVWTARRRSLTLFVLACALSLATAACGSVGDHKDSGGSGGSGGGGSGGGAGQGGGGAGGRGGTPDAGAGGSDGGNLDGASGGAGGGGATDASDGSGDARNCAQPASCAVLHACNPSLASGNNMIFPDGATDGGGLMVQCDMETGGGGWTVIYLANAVNLGSTAIDYTVRSQRLRDSAQEALIAFRNLNLNMVASDWASFGLPAAWRARNPLAVSPFEELTVSTSVNGALPALALLRYGTANFSATCSDPWASDTNYGRVCLQGTAAAFFSGFTVATPATDYCSLSNQSYSTRACSDTARFSIAVR